MGVATTLAVVPQRRCKATQFRVPSRFAAALWRCLSELVALRDRGTTLEDLPQEFFRFPPI